MRYDPPEPREQLKRHNDLAKLLKEVSTNNEWQRAELEAKAYEVNIAVLLSVYHQSSAVVDWRGLAFALPPHAPAFYARNYIAESLAACRGWSI
jgi:hypothetical protein